ncbi:MAG TPA: hypothetical protein VHH36_07580 [Candidatus Thermoplasmatota archaeon]|nr:hypothetical protein [Candidatus Thermoplasmatota archaeon]
MRLAALALVPLLLSGCVGSEEPAALRAPTPDPDVAGPSPLARLAANATPDDPAPPPARLDVAWDGRVALAFGACPARLRSHCVEPAGDGGGEQEWTFEGLAVGGFVNLTWTAAAPPTERLRVMALACGPETCETLGQAEGASPLALAIAPATDANATSGLLYVTTPHPLPPASAVSWLSLPQAFRAEGAVLVAQAS